MHVCLVGLHWRTELPPLGPATFRTVSPFLSGYRSLSPSFGGSFLFFLQASLKDGRQLRVAVEVFSGQ
ncbi:unnamed protein product [Colias eurytheme]|nr:unnamed protein product [Colias eurytheme]